MADGRWPAKADAIAVVADYAAYAPPTARASLGD